KIEHGYCMYAFSISRYKKCNSQPLHAGNQRQLILAMAFPARLESFLEDDAQRFAQRKNDGDRRSVVIGAVLAPEIHRGGQIEIPALHRSLAPAQYFLHARPHRNRSHAGRSADGLLRSAEAEIDPL